MPGSFEATQKSSDASRLEERIDELGLAPTEAFLSRATIKPETLARRRPARLEEDAGTMYEASLGADRGALPRISVEGRSELAGSSQAGEPPDFAVLSLLGEGGMGRVLLARQHSLAREIALKTVKPGAASTASLALVREARTIGALEHPGVVPIHLLAFDSEGRPMLVMKRVDGVDLDTLLDDPEHPAWKARGRSVDRLVASLEILVQVCLTLEFAHSRGTVHRDIKPENIMVGSFGEVYLLDWGIAAKMDEVPKELVGTPAYMPPEMALGERVDARTDVYLVGATLHAILTRGPRHDGKNIKEVLRSAAASVPFAYSERVPAELAALCNRATSRSRSDRPANIAEFREALSSFIHHSSARTLNEAALARLDELEALLGPAGAPVDLARAYRLVAEARFGFALNLREHAADAIARAGMRRCLTLAIELELRQEHAESADALLRELEGSHPELERRIHESRERAASYSRRRVRLEQLDLELDPTQNSWKRGIWLLAVAAIAIGVGTTVSLGGTPTPKRSVTGMLLVALLTGAVLLAFRRRVSWNAFNKRLMALVVAGELTMLAHRLIAMVYRTPVHETMTIDLAITCGMTMYAAFAVTSRLALAALPSAVGILMAIRWPERGPSICIAALTIALLVGAAALTRGENRDAEKR